jgi:hypothetical protein
MNTFKFKLKDGSVKEMTIDELTRWACLLEGIDQVAKKYEDLGESMDTDDWIKPLAFQKYIEERFHSMRHDLVVEASLGRL